MSITSPYLITGPAVISNSGGRTSGYMTRQIFNAHGGSLPNNVVCCFANTGREMESTLKFVRDQELHWGVKIVWLEYGRAETKPFVQVNTVNYETASRNGEPFAALLRAKKWRLPTPSQRFCTEQLKVKTIRRYITRTFGWRHWTNVVGLRADEGARVDKMVARNSLNKVKWNTVAPLSSAGVEEKDVFSFWRDSNFDLQTAGPHEGNCDFCFLKRIHQLERMFLDHPQRGAAWEADEKKSKEYALSMGHPNFGGTYRKGRTYSEIRARVLAEGRVSTLDLEDPEIPCEDAGCGV